MHKLDNISINNESIKNNEWLEKNQADKKEALSILLILEDIFLDFMKYSKYTLFRCFRFHPYSGLLIILYHVKVPKNSKLPDKFSDLTTHLYNNSNRNAYTINIFNHYFYMAILKTYERTFFANIKFNWSHMGKSKVIFIISSCVKILCTGFSIIVPAYTSQLIISYTDNNFEQILFTAIIIGVCQILNYLGTYISDVLNNKVYYNVKRNLIFTVASKILNIENRAIDKYGTGIFTQRLTSDVESVAVGIQSFVSMTAPFLNYVGVMIAVFFVNKFVFVYLLFFFIVSFIIEKKRSNHLKKQDRIYRETNENFYSIVNEMTHGLKDIKLFNGKKNFSNILKKVTNSIADKGIKMNFDTKTYTFVRQTVLAISQFGLYVILGWMLFTGKMAAANAVLIFSYNQSMESYLFAIITDLFNSIVNFNLSCERLVTLLNSSEFPFESFGEKNINQVKGNLKLKNINFAYNHDEDNADINILKNLNLEVKEKETVALVGKSGSGKTTIFNLIGQIYKVYDGEILLDGISYNDLDEDTIRGNIVTVIQNAHIFNLSIKDNLLIANQKASDEDIKNACRIACMDDYIESLPDKYDTMIGQNGASLSGGQIQRLAIARSILKQSPILLLDESTSALDNITQKSIMDEIKKINCTVIIVAHRLSTIKDVDKIYYVGKGKIIASGKHEELLEKCEEYRELYDSEN